MKIVTTKQLVLKAQPELTEIVFHYEDVLKWRSEILTSTETGLTRKRIVGILSYLIDELSPEPSDEDL